MTEGKTKKKNNNESLDDQDMDTGYSWIVLTDHFSQGSGNTAWIGSIAWFLLQGLVPLAIILTRRFSFRLVSFVSGILVGCGYFFSGFVKQMELMYLTFTIAGVGSGLSYTSSATIISFYFKKRRTLANGIMVSSGGIAVLLLPFLYRFLIDTYGLSHAFWIIGAILSNVCVASCVFRQPKSLLNVRKIPSSDNEAHSGQEKSMERRCAPLNLKFSLFKNRRFTLLIIAFTLCTIGHINNSILIPAHIKALGYSNTYVTIGVSITGGAELIARVVIGWFADLNIISKINIFVVCTFVGGLFALISPLFDNFMAIYAGVAGAFPASFLALLSVLAIERVGIDNFQSAFAFISFFMSLVSLITLPISGSLADYYGNWYPSFIFTGVPLTCAGATALLDNVLIRFGMNKKYSLEKDKRKSLEIVDMEMVSQDKCAQSNKNDTNDSNNETLDKENVYINTFVGNYNPAFEKR